MVRSSLKVTEFNVKSISVATVTTILFKIHQRLQSIYFKTNSAKRETYLQETILPPLASKERDQTVDVCPLKVQPCSDISSQNILKQSY